MVIEAKTINYTRNSELNILTTPCPYGIGFMVGSYACGSCKYTKGINFKDHYVYCSKELTDGKS